MQVWKYSLPGSHSPASFTITMPKGGVVLKVGLQEAGPVMWVRVDPAAEQVYRNFKTVWTGRELPEFKGFQLVYRGSWEQDGLVAHLFEQEAL